MTLPIIRVWVFPSSSALTKSPTAAALSFILMAGILIAVGIYARVLGTDELTSAR
jgi:hypothetical protein